MPKFSQLGPLETATTIAGISTSVFFIGNLTNSYFGIVPAVLDSTNSDSKRSKAKAWLFFYDRAKTVMAGASTTSFVAFSTILYQLWDLPLRQSERRLAGLGAVMSIAALPWTLILMAPINTQLQQIVQGDTAKEPYAEKLIVKWKDMHVIRMIFGGVSYVSALCLQSLL